MAGTGIKAVGAYFSNSSARSSRLQAVPDRVTRARTGRRLLGTGFMLTILFVLIVWKLVDLQVLNPTTYAAFGESQRVRTEVLAADRGTILDRNGVALALSTPQKSVFVDPKLIEDPKGEAARLATILAIPGLDAASIEAKMTATNRFSYVARQQPDDVIAKIRAEQDWKDPADPKAKATNHLPGVAFVDEPKRFVPSDELAKSLIGQVDIDGNGISGLEKMYGDDLTGTPGQLVLERGPDGRTIAPVEPQVIPAVKGKDLQLTIDRSMQYDTERILTEQVRDAGAKSGIAVVMKPDTGEILSMANVVSDPKTGAVSIDGNNAALTTVYEPGSVMKIVTASGAIEDGKVQPDTIIPISDTIQICDARFEEHDPHGNVGWPVSRILAQSSNVGTIKLGQMLGKDEIYRYMKDFGFGARTAIGFPNEQTGDLKTPDKWWCSSQGSIPIGNGVSVTPLQMLGAYNTIANQGVYVAPKLVNATIDGNGQRHENPADVGHRVISADTANKVNLMLRGVVAEGGTGTAASIAGYNPAGKTGTARKPQPGGGYVGADGITHYEASFVGFVPAEAPALSVFVMIDDPSKEGIYGGVVAAPAFSKIGEAALRRFSVPPPVTDVAAGGAKTDQSLMDPTKVTSTTVVGDTSVVEHTKDGRVRAPTAGEEPPTTVPAAGGTTSSGGTTATTTPAGTGTKATATTSKAVTTTVPSRPTTTPSTAKAVPTAPRKTP